MHRENDGEIDRRPGHVEEGNRTVALQEMTDRLQVAQRLAAPTAAPEGLQRDGLENPVAQALVEYPADAHEEP